MARPVILLIDDDKTMLNSLMDQLRHAFKGEFTIEAVQTIPEARSLLDMMKEQGVNVKLIISDWLMPPDRTNQLLVDIYQKYPEINIIMLSGYADDEAITHVKQNANLRSFIRKPWEEEELVAQVRSFAY